MNFPSRVVFTWLTSIIFTRIQVLFRIETAESVMCDVIKNIFEWKNERISGKETLKRIIDVLL